MFYANEASVLTVTGSMCRDGIFVTILSRMLASISIKAVEAVACFQSKMMPHPRQGNVSLPEKCLHSSCHGFANKKRGTGNRETWIAENGCEVLQRLYVLLVKSSNALWLVWEKFDAEDMWFLVTFVNHRDCNKVVLFALTVREFGESLTEVFKISPQESGNAYTAYYFFK